MTRRRGLTLLELIMSLSITSMVGLGIASMMGVTSAGVSTHQDTRSVMLRGYAAQTRLVAYVAPSRCVLGMTASDLVLWLADSRQSDTVHSTEIRWLTFDEDSGTIEVHWVAFPETWSEAAKALADVEQDADANWWTVLASFQGQGRTRSTVLVDGLNAVSVRGDASNPQECRHVEATLSFTTESEPVQVPVAATIIEHEPPAES